MRAQSPNLWLLEAGFEVRPPLCHQLCAADAAGTVAVAAVAPPLPPPAVGGTCESHLIYYLISFDRYIEGRYCGRSMLLTRTEYCTNRGCDEDARKGGQESQMIEIDRSIESASTRPTNIK